ncbi:MAG: site-specific DNA-methyltransferase [Ignavibacterium sp.]|jgi:adenine-specific DNA-methyltransferase|nr:site-specific DNA-methyltransferase [Ignavibacterium sp.]
MNHKPKLELTWIGKDEQPKLEPRILIEDPEKSYGDKNSENMLIYGDNLLALKALEQDFTGKIKCIYIDPPYNTGNAFEHYDDGVEHSLWLSLMKPRLEILKNLLSEDGSIWISIDADESHYLKVLCDEIFGRNNFVDEVIWQRAFSPINLKKTLSRSHDAILVYSKNSYGFNLNQIPRRAEQLKNYKNPDEDPRGLWASGGIDVGPIVPSQVYEIITPSGRKVLPPDGYCWRFKKEKFLELVTDNRIWFGKNGDNVPRIKRFLSEVKEGVTAMTLWLREEVGDNQEAKREVKQIIETDVFTTPKPERLLQRILTLSSNNGDWILDSFLGSGTTSAVAHKMNRRWIGIELGDHCHTHCIPRLQKVCDGADQGGISEAVNWKGGGGFKYYYLAPSLLKQDKYGNWIIEEKYNADMLAAAMAKHNNFNYQPSEEVYWKQGQSTEKDFIYTTTQFITVEKLDHIHEEMQPDESLLICCKKFSKPCENRYSNITIKKIPQMLLGKCEFGKEDYSLNIISMPRNENEPEFVPKGPEKKAKKTEKDSSPGLFTNEDQV